MVASSLSSIPVRIVYRGESLAAELNRVAAPRTVEAVVMNLPLEGPAIHTGDQVYFRVNLGLGVEKPRRDVQAGTIGYWPLGDAVCIFLKDFRPYSPVNTIGRLSSNPSCLAEQEAGSIIRFDRDQDDAHA